MHVSGYKKAPAHADVLLYPNFFPAVLFGEEVIGRLRAGVHCDIDLTYARPMVNVSDEKIKAAPVGREINTLAVCGLDPMEALLFVLGHARRRVHHHH